MRLTNPHYHCAVIGDWHLAFVGAASLSSLGHRILLVNPLCDETSQVWENFPNLNLHEPGLKEMIAKSRERGFLDYANGISADWEADFLWLAVDTPVNDKDEVILEPLYKIAGEISKTPHQKKALIVNSQVPLGFCAELEKRFELEVVYIPENLRLGKGIETFLKPDRIVIGAESEELRKKVQTFLKAIPTEFLLSNLATAEMIKHATNAFLATSISFANELARLGEAQGVDAQAVAKALKLDKRIGPSAYVSPGLGFAGGTLPRDLRVLQKLGEKGGYPTHLVNAVLDVNASILDVLTLNLRNYLGGTLKNKKIFIFGYSYKADIDTLRRSLSLELATELKKEGTHLYGYDPLMNGRDLSSLKGLLDHTESIEDSIEDIDAIVMMTDRKDFHQFSWPRLAKKGTSLPTLFLDAVGSLEKDPLLKAGLTYKTLWQKSHFPR